MEKRIADGEPERLTRKGWLVIFAGYLVVPVVLIGVTRDPGWWQAWVFSLIVHVAGVGGRAWADRRHPGLLAERMRVGRGQRVEPWDKWLAPLMAVSVLYLPVIVGSVDHQRGWSSALPTWVNTVGLILCAVGYGVSVWALVENRFFSTLVRIQVERGHQVCDSGPYRLLRHPGYAGNLLAVLGIPLALGSMCAFLASAVALAISLRRTALEDRALMEKLPGYRDYARRVRFRLLPGLW